MPAKDFEMIKKVYSEISNKQEAARNFTGSPLTLAEKLLYSHVAEMPSSPFKRGEDYALLNPDRVAMQDATAQMALLQFMQANLPRTAVPTTVHADHLIVAEKGAEADLKNGLKTNAEVYDFLESVSAKYGIGFWRPGAGIIHQIVLENYAFPGGMMIGTDSHTPNAGGMGMFAVGVGGADAVDVMAGMPWELKFPKIFGVKLTGKLSGWASPKDVILKLLKILTVKGGTGAVMEYFGEGCESISATGKATITNMGAELGATCSLFPFDEKHAAFLRATGRSDVAELAEKSIDCLRADSEVYKNPEQYFDQVIEINLSELEPHLNGPFTPDRAWAISEMKDAVKNEGFTETLSAGLIGSCTNSSYEDIDKAAKVARRCLNKGLKSKAKLYISPGSDAVRATLERDGQIATLTEFGAVILTNACGPCIGQWKRTDVTEGKNSIVHSFNRNFKKRADGNPDTLAFVSSPEMIIAQCAAGRITFNPAVEDIGGVRLDAPQGKELPESFETAEIGLTEPPENGNSVEVIVSPSSERLQLLTPFDAWDGNDYIDLPLLFKAQGKCTTDHISMAGPWLRYRGHLDNISDNMLIGGVNAFTGETGTTKNIFTGDTASVPAVARDYKARGIGWVIVGDENYGEGSSREHAAMEPRHLGGRAVIVRSFARIHETNLKKQGMLGLTFENPADYDKVKEGDRLSITGVTELAVGSKLALTMKHADGTTDTAVLLHTLSPQQIEWFKAGSALNLIAKSK